MNEAYLCLGGNMGDREAFLAGAVKEIGERAGRVLRCSPLYETQAWGVSDQQPYLNQCVQINTALDPRQLLDCLLAIECQLGRTRDPEKVYGPRTVDIDILLYNNLVTEQAGLVIPHPRMHLRRFVLVPLHDLAPERLHPVYHKSIFDLLTVCPDTADVWRYPQTRL